MPKLTTTLTMSSADAFAHQPINISTNIELTVEAPYTDLSRVAAPVSGVKELHPASGAGVLYFYVKHTGLLAVDSTATTNVVTVLNATGEPIATLGAQEFLFIPVTAGEGLEVTSAGGAVFVEYLYFTKG
tara:strand:+ start:545 stop:934 length:390 start_codon:yes stop_codon:yes gene_type:complete